MTSLETRLQRLEQARPRALPVILRCIKDRAGHQEMTLAQFDGHELRRQPGEGGEAFERRAIEAARAAMPGRIPRVLMSPEVEP